VEAIPHRELPQTGGLFQEDQPEAAFRAGEICSAGRLSLRQDAGNQKIMVYLPGYYMGMVYGKFDE